MRAQVHDNTEITPVEKETRLYVNCEDKLFYPNKLKEWTLDQNGAE